MHGERFKKIHRAVDDFLKSTQNGKLPKNYTKIHLIHLIVIKKNY